MGVELIAADLKMIQGMFEALLFAAGVEGVEEVWITFRGHGSDTITVGYGEQAEPAVIGIEPAEPVRQYLMGPPKVSPEARKLLDEGKTDLPVCPPDPPARCTCPATAASGADWPR